MSDDPNNRGPADRGGEDAVTHTHADSATHRLPKQIGQFHVKALLAAGGMGVVYRAVQEQPRRTVAVKVMKHGIASRSAMRRFEYESQVLARLRHPGIAQVFEAGTHDDGTGPVPYFAMEYIPSAKTITLFANEKKLKTRERLELFAQACDAVHHGHQKGIIHRDLKPDNILVDTQGKIKIIDFGVARGTDSDLAVTTLQTDVGQLIGTLQYMSPEQCEADPDAIDARSDVYSLGVVLFELISGQLPYRVSRKHLLDGTRAIKENEPTRLSTINRTLRGDIETIVLKTLEKDRDRRYQSAAELAQDIRFYLRGDAITARPPSAAYRLSLFARRNRSPLGVAALLAVVASTAGVMVARSQDKAREAEFARAAAIKRALEAEKTANVTREPEAPSKKHPSDLIGQKPPLFYLSTAEGKPVGTQNFAANKATILNFIALNCPYSLKQIPKLEGIRAEYEPQGVRFVNVLGTMGKDYSLAEASELLDRFGCHMELAKDPDNRVKDLFHRFGWPGLFILDGEGTVTSFLSGNRSELMAELRGRLDSVLYGIPTPEAKLAQAEAMHREKLKNNRRTLGTGHRDTLRTMESLADNIARQGRLSEAEKLYREILRTRQQYLGERDPQTLVAKHNLGMVILDQNKPAEAEELFREVLEQRRLSLGEDDPATRQSMAYLGLALHRQGKSEGAEPYIAELIQLRRHNAQQRDVTATTLNQYAWLLLTCEPEELRDPKTALPVAKEAARLSGRQSAEILDTLAVAQKMTGDLDAAIETQKEALKLLSCVEFETVFEYGQVLAAFYREAGRLDELEQWYRDSVAEARAILPPGSLALAMSIRTLGEFLLEQQRFSEAERAFREVLEMGRQALPENHWRIYEVETIVGTSLAGQGRFEEAESIIVNAYPQLKKDRHIPPEDLQKVRQRVVDLYTAWGKPEQADQYRAGSPNSDIQRTNQARN